MELPKSPLFSGSVLPHPRGLIPHPTAGPAPWKACQGHSGPRWTDLHSGGLSALDAREQEWIPFHPRRHLCPWLQAGLDTSYFWGQMLHKERWRRCVYPRGWKWCKFIIICYTHTYRKRGREGELFFTYIQITHVMSQWLKFDPHPQTWEHLSYIAYLLTTTDIIRNKEPGQKSLESPHLLWFKWVTVCWGHFFHIFGYFP